MFKKFALLALSLGLLVGAAGCVNHKDRDLTLTADWLWSGKYVSNHVKKIGYDLHDFRVDIDRTFFGLEDTPIGDGW